MAFRRSAPFRRRTFSRFRSGGRSKLRYATANKVWQRANIHQIAALEIPDIAENTTTVTFRLASTSSLGLISDTQGIALDQALRQVRIGGVVLGRIITPITTELVTDDWHPSATWMVAREHLFIDRVSGTGGQAGNAPDYGQSQFPVANATTTTPGVTTIDPAMPMKILWTNVFRPNMSVYQVSGIPESTGVVLDNGSIRPGPGGMLNKRLRTIIDDFTNLYYSVSFITPPGWERPAEMDYRIGISGWLYYRLGF